MALRKFWAYGKSLEWPIAIQIQIQTNPCNENRVIGNDDNNNDDDDDDDDDDDKKIMMTMMMMIKKLWSWYDDDSQIRTKWKISISISNTMR